MLPSANKRPQALDYKAEQSFGEPQVLLATIARIANQASASGAVRYLPPSASEAQATRNALQLA